MSQKANVAQGNASSRSTKCNPTHSLQGTLIPPSAQDYRVRKYTRMGLKIFRGHFLVEHDSVATKFSLILNIKF